MSTFHRETALGEHLPVGANRGKIGKKRLFWTKIAITFCGERFRQIPFDQELFALGEHRLQSLSLFRPLVKKLANFEITVFLNKFRIFAPSIFAPSILNTQSPSQILTYHVIFSLCGSNTRNAKNWFTPRKILKKSISRKFGPKKKFELRF